MNGDMTLLLRCVGKVMAPATLYHINFIMYPLSYGLDSKWHLLSGLSCGCWLWITVCAIHGHWKMQVEVMKRPGLWYSHSMAISFWKIWCRYLGLTFMDSGRMTFILDLMSSGLLEMVRCTKIAIRIASDQQSNCKNAAGIVPGQLSSFQWSRRQRKKGWVLEPLAEYVCSLLPESSTFPKMVVAILREPWRYKFISY